METVILIICAFVFILSLAALVNSMLVLGKLNELSNKNNNSNRLDEIKESMEQKGSENEPEALRVQCFGNFEVFWKGKPLLFARRQTKELFAYLVDRKGASCTMGEIGCALWEDSATAKNRSASPAVRSHEKGSSKKISPQR
jgi:two-component SAPR family response regulator